MVGYGPRIQESRDGFRHLVVLLFYAGFVLGSFGMDCIP